MTTRRAHSLRWWSHLWFTHKPRVTHNPWGIHSLSFNPHQWATNSLPQATLYPNRGTQHHSPWPTSHPQPTPYPNRRPNPNPNPRIAYVHPLQPQIVLWTSPSTSTPRPPKPPQHQRCHPSPLVYRQKCHQSLQGNEIMSKTAFVIM